MATLQELSTAFTQFRKRVKPKKRGRYPAELIKAVCDFKSRNQNIDAKELAIAIGVVPETVDRWLNKNTRGKLSNFAPVKIIDDSWHQRDELRISKGSVTVSALPDADKDRVYELLKILMAG